MPKNGTRNSSFRASCIVGILAIAATTIELRASAQTDLSFEVATVKPVDPSHRFDGKRFWAHVNPAGASYWSMTPVNLITYAYGVELYQVTGPEWTNADRFDIETRFPEGADPKDDRRMLQALLKDRFKLSFHIEEKQLEGYVLVVGKHGEKLRPSLPDPVAPETNTPLPPEDRNLGEVHAKSQITQNRDGSSTVDLGKRGTQTVKFDQELRAMHFEVSKMTMEELAGRLSNCLGSGMQRVEDQTGLKGTYQLAYDCPLPTLPSSNTAAAGTLPSDTQDGSSLAWSLDALGLKLERRKFLQKVYVIDHVERPSEN